MSPAPLLRTDLRTHSLDDDLLVYDQQNEQVHLLNSSAALVFQRLQEGLQLADIEKELSAQYGSMSGDELLAVALDELRGAQLLDHRDAGPGLEQTRRAMLQKLAGAGAALLIPAIVTLAPNRAYGQGSQAVLGAPCTVNTECLSQCCGKNSTGPCHANTCVDPNTCDCTK
jgi:PqqD family protein of HPr-rel-A system